MKATKYFATLHGHTFTRGSTRVYTHMVVAHVNLVAAREQAVVDAVKGWDRDLQWFQDVADGKPRPGYGNHPATPRTQDEIDAAKAHLARGKEGFVDQEMVDYDRYAANYLKSADGVSHVYDAGWCGRPDLAAKLAAKTPGGVIVEAQIK